MVLLSRSAAYTHSANNFSAALQRNAASEDHYSTVIGGMNPEKLPARLGMLGEIFCRNIEGAGCECLVDRDVDAADLGTVHADVGHKIAAFVDHGDVHRLFDFDRLLLGGCNDLSCFFECHCHASFMAIPCNRSATTISHRSSRELSQVSPHWHAERLCRCPRSSGFMQFSFFRITLKA
jgi:hypothetical protein